MIVLAVVGWLAGWFLLGRMRRCRPVPNESKCDRAISIIIPARDEEENLPRLLRSIAEQSVRPREVIVVDDLSSDRTAEIAQQSGADVITSTPLPNGWHGKTWACHQGARAARAELLLFLDADTWLEREGLHRLLGEYQSAGGGALSVAPHHVVASLREEFSAFFNLVMLAGTGASTILGDHLPARGLLGQCLLLDRATYEHAGGHQAVRDRVVENFALGEKIREAGAPLRCRVGRGVISVRMYPRGWRALVDGWSKGFASGAAQTRPLLLLLVIAWLSGFIGLAVHATLSAQPLLYLLCVAQVAWLLRSAGTFRFLTSALYPAPLLFFFVVFARSIWRSRGNKAVLWKGRPVRAV